VKKTKTGTKLFYGGYIYHDLISALYGEETSRKWKIYETMAKKAIQNKEYDIVILDEINLAIDYDLIL
jgi:ATP:corrinoid adenosyltransferase